MAYCRWGEGPGRGGVVYLYPNSSYRIVCCDCVFTSPDDFICKDRIEAIAHLMEHMAGYHPFALRALTVLWVELFAMGPTEASTLRWAHGKPVDPPWYVDASDMGLV